MLMLAPAEVPTEDNSVVPKGVEETGIGVCLQGLMVSLGFSVTGPIKTDELAFQASEVLGALIGGVDIHVIVFCGLSGLTTLMQKPPRRRRRGKAISRATGGSRSWDLNVGKLQKNTQGLGRETWSAPLLLPTSLPTAKPNLWFNVLGFFFPFLLSLLPETTGEPMAPVTPTLSSHVLLAFTHCSSQWLLTLFSHHPTHLFKL